MMTAESQLIADRFRMLSDAELDQEEARIERGRHCCSRRQDLDRYNRRLVALTAERMRRCEGPSQKAEVRSPKSAAGFTLVECLAVVAVIGVLASAMAPSVARAARAATARAAWCRHFQEVRTWQLDSSTHPALDRWWCEVSTDEAFRLCYPQYAGYGEVPRSTVRYWRLVRDGGE